MEGRLITKGKSHEALVTPSIFELPFTMKKSLIDLNAKLWNEAINVDHNP
jgi:hypothetical protein